MPISKFCVKIGGLHEVGPTLNFWFDGKKLDLQILKIDLRNNLLNNDIDLKEIAVGTLVGQIHERIMFSDKINSTYRITNNKINHCYNSNINIYIGIYCHTD